MPFVALLKSTLDVFSPSTPCVGVTSFSSGSGSGVVISSKNSIVLSVKLPMPLPKLEKTFEAEHENHQC
jgi:hypothetical protein